MIIVTGHVLTNAENRAAIEAECIALSQRSRAEPGCLAHNVHADCEQPDRLVFVEKWQDRASLLTHFAVPESGAFVQAISRLSTERPVMDIYDATGIGPADLKDQASSS